jgi:hypothetical protein
VDDRYGRVRAAGSDGVIFDPGLSVRREDNQSNVAKTPEHSLRASDEWHRIVSDEHWQRAAAADPPQPIEHRAKQRQDRQRAHRRSRERLGKDCRHALRIEKNDPAAMNSAKHIRHRWRARRGPPRGTPNEAIDQALDLIAFREELARGFAAVRSSGGVDDVLRVGGRREIRARHKHS